MPALVTAPALIVDRARVRTDSEQSHLAFLTACARLRDEAARDPAAERTRSRADALSAELVAHPVDRERQREEREQRERYEQHHDVRIGQTRVPP
jgi:hypothetical protein